MLAAGVVGAAAGLLAGAAGAWLVAGDPGAGRGPRGTLRGDLDALSLELRRTQAAAEAGRGTLLVRLAELEGRVSEMAAAQGARPDTAPALEALAADLRELRDAVERELGVVDERLALNSRRVDEVAAAVGLLGGPGAAEPLTEDEEGIWVTIAKDADPLRRFSALVTLGRRKTDRAVRVSMEALRDDDVRVVWQAARNLRSFREPAAAQDLAGLLDHEEVEVRKQAYEALLALGAPADTGYSPVAPADDRRDGTALLARWAADVR